MASFAELKNQMKKNQEALLEELASLSKKNYDDERFWKVTRNEKTGNGSAIIRFLPSKHNKIPFVTFYEYAFKGPTGLWYIEKSLLSIGKPDPLAEINSALWASGKESDKEIVRKRKQKQVFVSNIYVVRDPNAPHNEGKVFLFKFGKKIMEKIQLAYSSEFEDLPKIDVFDLWEGANFNLRVKKGEGGFPNYDNSFFSPQSPLLDGNDAKLEKVYESTYDLSEFIDPKSFKTYEELKAKLDRVLGLGTEKPKVGKSVHEKNRDVPPWQTLGEDEGLGTPNEEEDDEDDVSLKKFLDKEKSSPRTEKDSSLEFFDKLMKEEEEEDSDDTPF